MKPDIYTIDHVLQQRPPDLTQVDPPSPTHRAFPLKMVILQSFSLFLTLILLFFSILSIVKVQRLFKWTELSLALSTIYISISLAFLIVIFSINLAECVMQYEENDY